MWCKIPPETVPTQTANVLSPKNLSENGELIETLKMLCHTYYPYNLSHLNHPLKAYSYGNLVYSSPTVSPIWATVGTLSIYPATSFLLTAGVSTSGTIPILGLNTSKLSINAPFSWEYETLVNIPLKAGYLLLSIPPRINLTYLVSGCVIEWVIDFTSSFPYLMKPTAFFFSALYE